METYNVKMTRVEKDNLLVFLERITLQPREIPSYVAIIKALNESEKVGEEDGNA